MIQTNYYQLLLLVLCPKAVPLCLVCSRHESYFLNINKARAYLYGEVPDSIQTENSYIMAIEDGISRTEVRLEVVQWFM